MIKDAWFPRGFSFPDGSTMHTVLYEGKDWQIIKTGHPGTNLVVREELYRNWFDKGLVPDGAFQVFAYGEGQFYELSSSINHILAPVDIAKAPDRRI